MEQDDDFALNIFNNLDNNGCDNSNNSGNAEPSIYVFGYGSLVWNPGFEYTKCITGCEFDVFQQDDESVLICFLLLDIRGYVRRFWQGNVTHRGTVDKVNILLRLRSLNSIFLSSKSLPQHFLKISREKSINVKNESDSKPFKSEIIS